MTISLTTAMPTNFVDTIQYGDKQFRSAVVEMRTLEQTLLADRQNHGGLYWRAYFGDASLAGDYFLRTNGMNLTTGPGGTGTIGNQFVYIDPTDYTNSGGQMGIDITAMFRSNNVNSTVTFNPSLVRASSITFGASGTQNSVANANTVNVWTAGQTVTPGASNGGTGIGTQQAISTAGYHCAKVNLSANMATDSVVLVEISMYTYII